ncbi:MAG TPA: alpha/beta fold hydrolase [Gemmatimonadaceae bacterium]|nr:alpha/beta fold hydrolase [Gemmatimonadaceae bacterium]
MRGEFIDLDGARLYYYAAGTRGAGEPVVFVHGFATSGHLWSDVVSLMPPGRRLVVLDLLGHGRSDPPAARALTLHAHAERVVALLDALGVASACVVGHGMGGGVAQSLAVHWPARVAKLALVSSIGFGDWSTLDVMFARATLSITRHLPPAWLLSMVRTELERGYGDAGRSTHSLDRYVRPFATRDGRAVLVRHLRALDARETASLARRLGEITCPTSVVWGAHDPFLPLSLGLRLADAIPGATFDVLQDARHFLPEDAPRPVADVLAALLAR